MNTKYLDDETGRSYVEALEFVYNGLKTRLQPNNISKNRKKNNKKNIFTEYISLLEKFACITISELFNDMESNTQGMLETLCDLEDEQDQSLLLDVQELLLTIQFFDMEEPDIHKLKLLE